MDRSVNANQLTLFDIADILNRNDKCPTIDRLYFFDARETEKMPRKQFPCYICGGVKEKDGVTKYLTIGILQWVLGGPQIVKINVLANKLNVQYKIWDRAPSENLIALSPFPREQKTNEKEEKLKKAIAGAGDTQQKTDNQDVEESGT